MADQMPARQVPRTQPHSPRPTLRYSVSNGTVPAKTPYGFAASQLYNPSQATPSNTGSKPPSIPLFNPAELQFFQHFFKTEDGDSQPQTYKPQLLSSYRFLSNSISAVTSTLSSYVHPSGSPHPQPYVPSSNHPDGCSGQLSALYSASDNGLNHSTNSYGHYEADKSTASVPSATPVVQTNSFMRPQSAKKFNPVNDNHLPSSESSIASVLQGPIVVECKPVSLSEQEREEKFRRKNAVKLPVSYSSLPRPPSAMEYNKDWKILSSQSKTSGESNFAHGMIVTGTDSLVGSHQIINMPNRQRTVENHDQKTRSVSPLKFHKPLVAPMGYIHKSYGVIQAPSPPVPPAVTGSAIRSPRAVVEPMEESRLANGSKTRNKLSPHSEKHHQRQPSFATTRNGGITSPSMSAPYNSYRPQANLTRSRSVPPETNPLLGTFLGHTKVKNLNYTPAKPYKDLVNSQNPVQDDALDNIDNIVTIKPKVPTVFYRKASKREESLNNVTKRPAQKKFTAIEWNRDCNGNDGDGPLSDSDGVQGDDEDDQDGFDGDEADEADDYDDDDDESALDGIDEEDDESSEDGKSVASSHKSQSNALRIRSATKRLLGLSLSRSTSQVSVKSRPSSSRSRASINSDYQPALNPSLFNNIPPSLIFVRDGYKVEQLPWELRKLLKWRISPITPNVVKNCIFRSHFRVTKKNHDWIGYWGKHMKSHVFKTIQDYQKVNHFPGSFQIGRKDKLWRNLSRYQVLYGKSEFNFFPQTFVLPLDMKLLKRAWEESGSRQKWIIKPPASARGIGIKLINKFTQIPKKQPVIVQRYLSRPYLINDSKFDMRIYVYVTSYDPLRIYVYEDGLARFASVKYSHCMKNINNKYMHLTNYSINKKNQDYQSNSDENACQGHKWTLKTLWQYMRKRGVDTRKVWESMLDLIIKTIITSESCVNSLVKANVHRRYSCHELFGFDIMLDETLKPWIIEVNISPSLHSNSSLDIAVKGGMITDLLNIAGFMIPDKKDVQLHSVTKSSSDKEQSFEGVYIDPRFYPTQLSSDERAKHCYYCQRFKDESVRASVLDTLTPDDIRILTETINEDSRKGDFVRVFPSPTSLKYHQFFEHPRYYNLLLEQWIERFGHMESEGIYLLNCICKKGIHLENPTTDPQHQWCQPLSNERRAVSAPEPPKFGASSNLPSLRKNRLIKVNGSRSWHGSGNLSSTKKKKKKGKSKTAKRKDEECEAEESEEN